MFSFNKYFWLFFPLISIDEFLINKEVKWTRKLNIILVVTSIDLSVKQRKNIHEDKLGNPVIFFCFFTKPTESFVTKMGWITLKRRHYRYFIGPLIICEIKFSNLLERLLLGLEILFLERGESSRRRRENAGIPPSSTVNFNHFRHVFRESVTLIEEDGMVGVRIAVYKKMKMDLLINEVWFHYFFFFYFTCVIVCLGVSSWFCSI